MSVTSAPPERHPPGVDIRESVVSGERSAVARYQDLVVGSRSLLALVAYEGVVCLTSWVPGAIGLVLRRIAYRWVLGAVGRNVVFGQGVVLRHPRKIRLGDDVVVDDLVMLDAKGTDNRGISIGRGSFLGRGTILSCKNGDIALGDFANIGFHSEIFSGSSVRVGHHALFAAYTYVVGGGHEFGQPGTPVIEQPRTSLGIEIGDNVWLGAGAKVLDGVRIGSGCVVGAGAVVTSDLPEETVAAGIPARVLRQRRDTPREEKA
jgi:acetyltransferase-like isoleucine patch superfamily enzyme